MVVAVRSRLDDDDDEQAPAVVVPRSLEVQSGSQKRGSHVRSLGAIQDHHVPGEAGEEAHFQPVEKEPQAVLAAHAWVHTGDSGIQQTEASATQVAAWVLYMQIVVVPVLLVAV